MLHELYSFKIGDIHMLRQASAPYRGYGIRLTVDALDSTSFEGEQRRYAVSWAVQKEDGVLRHKHRLESFTEPSEFTSAGEALDFGKARAQTYIDGIVALGFDR